MEEGDRICRICLKNQDLCSLFESFAGNQTFADILNECTKYQVNRYDHLPQDICSSCKIAALGAFKFKRKCEESYYELISRLSPESKKIILPSTEKLEKSRQTVESFPYPISANPENDGDTAVFCQFCEKSFKKNNCLKSHIAIYHSDEASQSSYLCPVCKRQFTLREHLIRHLTLIHEIVDFHSDSDKVEDVLKSDDSLLYDSCNVTNDVERRNNLGCKEENDQPRTVLQKSRQSSNPNLPLDQNVETTRVYKKLILFNKHMKAKHAPTKKVPPKQNENQLSDKTEKCSICDKNFSSKVYLQRHLLIHEKKRYTCKECTQAYLTKDELNAHLKAEGHDKLLLCPQCGLRCKTTNILMVHMRRHKGEKPFKCKFCNKGFPRTDDLRIHEKYHTGEKSHFCETCGKGFQRKYNLTIHLRVHTGEKPYKCPHCPQAFAQGNDLKAHIRRHTGERFRCDYCNAAFLQGYQIRQHKLHEHGIREDPPTQRVAKFTSFESQELQIKQNSKNFVAERRLDEDKLDIAMETLPLDINEISTPASDVTEVSLEVSDFRCI